MQLELKKNKRMQRSRRDLDKSNLLKKKLIEESENRMKLMKEKD